MEWVQLEATGEFSPVGIFSSGQARGCGGLFGKPGTHVLPGKSGMLPKAASPLGLFSREAAT